MEPLKSDYGDAVNINYFDINDPDIHPDIRSLVESRQLPFPLTFVNGEALSAGYISYYDIVRKLDEIFRAEEQ